MRLPFRRKSTVSLVANYVGGVPQWPPRNYRTYALEGMAKSPSVYGCMAARAQSASEIRLKVQQLIGKDWVDADDTTKRTPDATALQELIDNPNPLQSQSLYLQDVIQSLDFAGNSYTQIELSKSGQPIALWHLDRPDVMAIVPDPVKKIAGYVYNPGGAPIPIPPQEIIHHRHLSDPLNPLLGLPPMAVAARDIDVDNATTDFLKQFFDRGGVPAWAAMFQTAVDDKTAKEFVAKWEQKFSISQGGNAAGGIATLNARDVKLEKVGYGTSTRESGLTDIRMVIDARICSAFRVHPQVAFSLLGFLHPTYAQARMAQEMTWQMGLCPLYVRLADQTTISLRPYYPNCRVVADFSQVKALQEDESGLWTRHLNAAQEGYETREEFREAVGLPNEPKGTFLVPFKYVEQQPGEPLAPRVAVSESATVTAADITQQQETGEGNDDNPDTPNTPAGVPPPVSASERVATGRGKPTPKLGQTPPPAPGQKGGNAGNADSLRQWFVDGADGAISWGSHGDFEQCVAVAGKYMDDPEGYCNLRHQEAVGGPPGSEDKAVATRTRPKAVKYSDDQPRDDHGRFGSGGSSGGVSLKETTERAWGGKQTEGDSGLSKQDSGKLGEQIVLAHLQQTIPDMHAYNDVRNNTPVDLMGDHTAVEVKTGLTTNSSSAQQWRATIGQPGKAETELLKTMSPEDKRAWNDNKSQAIMERKLGEVDKLSKSLGYQVNAKTVAVIVNPSTKTADVYEFSGFHMRVGWNSSQARDGYVRSYRYG